MEFCTENCTFGPEKQKICTFYTKNEVFAKQFHQNVQILDKNWFLPNNFTKMYKVKTGVWYPKMYIWFRKREKFVLFTLIMKFLPKNFTKMYKFWIKTVALYRKIYIWSRKNKKIILFTLKMKFLQKKIH